MVGTRDSASTRTAQVGLARRMYSGFGAVLALLLALVVLANVNLKRLEEANQLNLHTYQVLEEANQLLAAVIDVQTGYRGFLLTGDRSFLEPLLAGQPALEHHLNHLRLLTREDPEQQARLAEVEAIAEEWIGDFVRPRLRLRQELDDGEVTLQELEQAIDPHRGKAYADSIRNLLGNVRAAELNVLRRRTARATQLRGFTEVTFILGALFAILITAVLASMAVRRSAGLISLNQKLRREAADRARAEATVRRLSRRSELILDTAADGIWGIDASGVTTFANPAAARMSGYPVEELVGRPAHPLLHHSHPDGTPYPEHACPITGVIRTGSPAYVSDEVFWRKDGESFPVEYAASPITEDERTTGVVVVFRDVTQRREVERMKDEFVSVVSHELRTPLTSIRGSLGLLSSGKLGALPERGQRLLEIATENTDRLVRLVNDVLDIERIESGRVEMERTACELDDLVRQAIELVQELAGRRDVRLETEPLRGRVWADAHHMVQVLTNLLSNAIKFSDPGQRVLVKGRTQGGEARLSVIDRGRGIPLEKQEQIFGRFQQVDASDSRAKGGTGLGLAIARSIVHQHGGRIWVESAPGQGSTFTFTIPLLSEKGALEAEDDRSDLPLILLCDDDESIRSVVGALLEEQGYRVRTASSGRETIDLARHQPPDAILLDLMMPDMDGWETLSRLKSDRRLREVPVVIFSALSPDYASTGAAVDWVTKASGDASLFGALERALGTGEHRSRVLLVEDDPALAGLLKRFFEQHGVEAVHARSCAEAVDLSSARIPDLVVLDLVHREGTTVDAVECLRRDHRLRAVPLVVYSAAGLTPEQRAALGDGTDVLLRGNVDPADFEERLGALLEQLVTHSHPRANG